MNESMGKKAAPHSISGVFVFLLLGIFALMGTAMVLMGVNAYRGIVKRSGMHNASRISTSYLRSMVRADDETGCIRLENLDNLPVVTLIDVYDGEEYASRLYVYEGSLRESFGALADPFDPELGEEVCAAEELMAETTGRLLKLRIRTDDTWHEADIALCAARP